MNQYFVLFLIALRGCLSTSAHVFDRNRYVSSLSVFHAWLPRRIHRASKYVCWCALFGTEFYILFEKG